MRIAAQVGTAILLAFGLLLPTQEAQAQVALGAHGTFLDWRGGAWGGGGRVAVVARRSSGVDVAIEGIGEYLVPSCSGECRVVAIHANLLARRRVYSMSEAYGGLGVVYEDYTVERSTAPTIDGSDWGVNLVGGSLFGPPGGIRPFVEVRWSLMFDIASQLGFAVGFRLPLS
jgi:hypothetical protein